MKFAKLSSKGQTTIPKAVRDACGLAEGDLLAVDVEGDRVVMRKVVARDEAYLRGLEETLEEWRSSSDEDAFADL